MLTIEGKGNAGGFVRAEQQWTGTKAWQEYDFSLNLSYRPGKKEKLIEQWLESTIPEYEKVSSNEEHLVSSVIVSELLQKVEWFVCLLRGTGDWFRNFWFETISD